MKNWIQILTFTLLVALAGCKGCREEDPCPSTRRTNAAFKIEEYSLKFDPNSPYFLNEGWKFYATDTAVLDRIRLTPADMKADRYQWIIGADTLSVKQPQIIGFTPWPPNHHEIRRIPITLTTWKSPDRNCFPDDSGKATVSKTMVAMHYSQSLVFGKWHVVFDNNPKDTSSFSLTFVAEPPVVRTRFVYYSGTLLKKDNCINNRATNFAGGYKQGIIHGSTCDINSSLGEESMNFFVDSPNSGSGKIVFGYTDKNVTKKFTATRIMP